MKEKKHSDVKYEKYVNLSEVVGYNPVIYHTQSVVKFYSNWPVIVCCGKCNEQLKILDKKNTEDVFEVFFDKCECKKTGEN